METTTPQGAPVTWANGIIANLQGLNKKVDNHVFNFNIVTGTKVWNLKLWESPTGFLVTQASVDVSKKKGADIIAAQLAACDEFQMRHLPLDVRVSEDGNELVVEALYEGPLTELRTGSFAATVDNALHAAGKLL